MAAGQAKPISEAEFARLMAALGPLGADPGAIDTLVLGCTHYPLARQHLLASLAGRAVTLVDPADAVASHARTRLAEAGLARPAVDRAPGAVRLCASGADAALHAAAARWLP